MYYFFLNDNWSCSRKLIDLAYTPFHAVLKCGHLTSDVQVFPRPEPFIIDEEIDPIPKAINTGNIFYCFLHQSVWFLPFHFHLFSCIVTVAPAFSLWRSITDHVISWYMRLQGTKTSSCFRCVPAERAGVEQRHF